MEATENTLKLIVDHLKDVSIKVIIFESKNSPSIGLLDLIYEEFKFFTDYSKMEGDTYFTKLIRED